jgi:DNA-binding Lrp family transcriptional regulator
LLGASLLVREFLFMIIPSPVSFHHSGPGPAVQNRVINPDSNLLCVVKKSKSKSGRNKEKILECIRNGMTTTNELAGEIEISRNGLLYHIRNLIEEGLICRTGHARRTRYYEPGKEPAGFRTVSVKKKDRNWIQLGDYEGETEKEKSTNLLVDFLKKEKGRKISIKGLHEQIHDKVRGKTGRPLYYIPGTASISNRLAAARRAGVPVYRDIVYTGGTSIVWWYSEDEGTTEGSRVALIVRLREAGKMVSVDWLIEQVQDKRLTEQAVIDFLEKHEDAFENATGLWVHRDHVPDWWGIEKSK